MLFPMKILLLVNHLAVHSKRIIFHKSIIEKVGNNDYSNDFPALSEAEDKKKKKNLIGIGEDMKKLKKNKDMMEEVLLSDNDYDNDYDEDDDDNEEEERGGQDYFKLHYGYDYSDNYYMDQTDSGDELEEAFQTT